MKWILDTNVISELRKTQKHQQHGGQESVIHLNFIRWAKREDLSSCGLSVITIFELELGVRRLERKDTTSGAVLRQWLENQVKRTFQGRVLPLTAEIAEIAASLHVS